MLEGGENCSAECDAQKKIATHQADPFSQDDIRLPILPIRDRRLEGGRASSDAPSSAAISILDTSPRSSYY
jgi:hypothetical protein